MLRVKFHKLFFIILFVIPLIGLGIIRPVADIKKTKLQQYIGSSITIFHENEERVKNIINTNENSIDFKIQIINDYPDNQTYEIIVIYDYKQKSFFVTNKQYNHYSVNINGKKDIIIPLRINDIDDGLHEVTFVAIRKHKGIPPEEFIPPSYNFISKTIHIKKNTSQFRNHQIATFKKEPCSVNNIPGVFLIKDKSSVSQDGITVFTREVIDSPKLDFFIYKCVPGQKDNLFTILIFLDYQQSILFQNNYIYENLTNQVSQESLIIPVSIDPVTKGHHDLFAMLITYPKNEVGKNELNRIFFSNLINIYVQYNESEFEN